MWSWLHLAPPTEHHPFLTISTFSMMNMPWEFCFPKFEHACPFYSANYLQFWKHCIVIQLGFHIQMHPRPSRTPPASAHLSPFRTIFTLPMKNALEIVLLSQHQESLVFISKWPWQYHHSPPLRPRPTVAARLCLPMFPETPSPRHLPSCMFPSSFFISKPNFLKALTLPHVPVFLFLPKHMLPSPYICIDGRMHVQSHICIPHAPPGVCNP